MTIAFKCSDCETLLKVADTFAGKRCKCPKCAVINTVPAADEEAVDEPAPKVKKAATSVSSEPPKPQKKAKAPVPEEEADDLEDTEPVEEEDNKPKKKKSKGKTNKPKKGGSKMMLILGGLGALLFVACLGCGGVGGGAAWYFGLFSSTPDEFKYLPTGTTSIHSQRVEQLRNSQIFKDVIAANNGKDPEFDNFEKSFGLPINNVERRVIGSSRGPGGETITVVRTKASVQASEIIGKLKQGNATADYTETKVGKYTMNEPKTQVAGLGQAFCVVESKLVIFGLAKTVRAVLERDKNPDFSEGMKTAMRKADFSKTETKVDDYSGGAEQMNFTGIGFGGLGKKGAAVDSHVEETDAGIDFSQRTQWTFKDATAASDAKKTWEDDFQKAKTAPITKEFLGEVQASASVSGTTLIIDVKIPSKVFTKMLGKR